MLHLAEAAEAGSDPMVTRRPLTKGIAGAGFSLLELMLAVSVLAVGMLGGIGLICVAKASDGGSRLNTTAATLAESTMESILAVPASTTGSAALTTVTDCRGNANSVNTAVITDGSPAGVIDFTQPAVPQYSMLYSMCSASGGLTFDVRWRVDAGPTPSTQLVTVSVKSIGTLGVPASGIARKTTLQALRGN